MPDLRLLPDFKLLEMQWILHRVAAMSGAAEANHDSDDDSNYESDYDRDYARERETCLSCDESMVI